MIEKEEHSGYLVTFIDYGNIQWVTRESVRDESQSMMTSTDTSSGNVDVPFVRCWVTLEVRRPKNLSLNTWDSGFGHTK